MLQKAFLNAERELLKRERHEVSEDPSMFNIICSLGVTRNALKPGEGVVPEGDKNLELY